MSEDNFEYVDNPEVLSLRNTEVIRRFTILVMTLIFTQFSCSGGVDLIFVGKQLHVVPTNLVIRIINSVTGSLVMNYTTVSVLTTSLIF